MTLGAGAVIVVGTSPNIGAGIATVLGEAGAAVVCVDRNEAYAESCAAHLRGLGYESLARTVDATDPLAVEDCVNDLPRRLGRVFGLVNGAVHYDERGLLEMTLDAWRAQLEVLLTATFLFTKATAARMVDAGGGGSIVNVASTAAHQGQPGNIAYSTAKAGILNFTRAAAMDLAPYGIRVNSLTPTSTDPSDAHERADSWGLPSDRWAMTERAERRRRLLPLGFAPGPRDYGHAVCYLLSEASRAVTGSDLRVDAGAVAKYWAAGTTTSPSFPGEGTPRRFQGERAQGGQP